MDCQLMQSALVGWHFGVLDASERDEVEAHLVRCARCVREFVGLKRSVEQAESADAAVALPSHAARAKLRSAVARSFVPDPDAAPVREPATRARPRFTSRRGVRVGIGAGLAAMAAAALLLVFDGEPPPKPPPHRDSTEKPVDVDTAAPAGPSTTSVGTYL